MKTLFAEAFLLSSCALFGFTTLTAAPKVFDVRDSGAKGDGKTSDTVAIQQALDECGRAGGGIVRIPAGTYLCKPLYMRSKTTLELQTGAVLKATDNEADFADPTRPGAWRAFVALINGRKLSKIAITGPGKIDGSGERWWGPAKEAKRTNTLNPGYTLPRPKLIVLKECDDVRVEHITLMNSPCFHLVPTGCENVVIDDVTITAPADSPNTDAIDPSASRHVRINNCRLDVGDDNIAIKAGSSASGRHPACEDIVITDCTFLHGHGMSIGSETVGGVRNVTVKHCTFQDTENGLRIKSPRGKGGTVENIKYSDITMVNVDPAILFTCYYPKIPKIDSGEAITASTPVFRNIQISNLTATCPRGAGVIVGSARKPDIRRGPGKRPDFREGRVHNSKRAAHRFEAHAGHREVRPRLRSRKRTSRWIADEQPVSGSVVFCGSEPASTICEIASALFSNSFASGPVS